MEDSTVELKAGEHKKRWLRYEIARLATLRNLLSAGIIAAGACAVVYATLLALWPAPGVPQADAAATDPGAAQQPANTDIELRLPSKVGAPDTTATSNQEACYGADGEKLVPVTQEIRDKISVYLAQNGIPEGFNLYDVQEACGHTISNVVYVEKGPTWQHAIAIMPKGRLTHMYFFNYACGHQAMTTPDPYRDLMYAQPQHVADRYAKRLCDECQSMREYQLKKKAGHGAP